MFYRGTELGRHPAATWPALGETKKWKTGFCEYMAGDGRVAARLCTSVNILPSTMSGTAGESAPVLTRLGESGGRVAPG